MFDRFDRKQVKRAWSRWSHRRDDALAGANGPAQRAGERAETGDDGMILMFCAGLLEPEEFFASFIKSGVFFLVKSLDEVNAPLFLRGTDGAPRLALFSSPERAQTVHESNPGYRYAVKLPCHQILIGVKAGNGLVMNPGSETVTFQMTPDLLRRFRADFLSNLG